MTVFQASALTDSIQFITDAPLAEIVFNKPEKRNALSLDMWAAIPQLIDNAVSSPEVKVLIIHGGVSGAFAAGADIAEFDRAYASAESAKSAGLVIARALTSIETCTKPTLAAIDGACVGGGVSVALACDIRLASKMSKFGITPAKLGLVYPAGDTRRLLTAIGPGAAKDLLFTGRVIEAQEAMSLRLIDRLVTEPSALDAARTLAREISDVSQWSTRAIKQMIMGLQNGWCDDDEEAIDLFVEGFSNEDHQEGYRAFLAKQPPKFGFK
ncbi:MAG: enoyl-CoA hydratase-related protein [Pseudomonadota bacterium]